jgi:hypothetical protein
MTRSRDDTTGRREFLKLTMLALAAGAGMAGSAVAQSGKATPGAKAVAAPRAGLKFFTASEFRTLEEMAEAIIPADSRSGGARAAGVPEFIDRRVGESLDPEWRQSWRDDLAEIERISQVIVGRGFVAASAEQRNRVLEGISRNERAPKEAAEFAFGTIKWAVAEVYYRTRIGIHDEIGYQGNTVQSEFTGIAVADRPGPRQ